MPDGGGIAPPKPPPAEFVGLARDLIRRVDAHDLAVIKAARAFADACAGCGRRGFRQPHLPAVLAAYKRQAPAAWLLSRCHELRGSKLTVFDTRVMASRGRWTNWEPNAAELELRLVIISLSSHRTPEVAPFTAAILSMHALARWYQRTALRDDALLMRDIAHCIGVPPKPCKELQVPCERGSWHGHVGIAELPNGVREMPFHARTFIDRDGEV